MAWASRMLPDGPRADRLESGALAGVLGLDLSDVRNAVALSRFPADWSLDPAQVETARETLTQSVLAAESIFGPWTADWYSLMFLDGDLDAVAPHTLKLLAGSGAPGYWNRIHGSEALMLAHVSDWESLPEPWADSERWTAALRTELLTREAARGGFVEPVVGSQSWHSTAAVVLTLFYAGADEEIEKRIQDLEPILCDQPESRTSNYTLLMVAHVREVAGISCSSPVEFDATWENFFEHFAYAYATGEFLAAPMCPPPSTLKHRRLGFTFLTALYGALSMEPGSRKGYVDRCWQGGPADVGTTDSVMGLFGLVALSFVAEWPIDDEAVLEHLSGFEAGSLYGYDGLSSLTDTCRALIIRAMLARDELIPVLCFT